MAILKRANESSNCMRFLIALKNLDALYALDAVDALDAVALFISLPIQNSILTRYPLGLSLKISIQPRHLIFQKD